MSYQLRIDGHLIEESADRAHIHKAASREAAAGTEFVSVWKTDEAGRAIGRRAAYQFGAI